MSPKSNVEKHVKDIRRNTRKQYSAEEKTGFNFPKSKPDAFEYINESTRILKDALMTRIVTST